MAYEEIRIKQEADRCLLCHNPACQKAGKGAELIADMIRSLRFENISGAYKKLDQMISTNPDIENSLKDCMAVCTRAKIDKTVDMVQIVTDMKNSRPSVHNNITSKVDLSTELCGVKCENPFFLSSSVVGSNYDMVAKAFDMGWAGVAFKTIGLFVPNEASPRFAAMQKESTPFVGFKNIEQISDHTFEENLGYLKKLKEDYPTKIIIASIMGQNEDEWTYLARKMEEAGADVIECNFSCPQMVGEGLGSDVGTNLELVAKYTAATKRGTKLPVLAKMTPNITKMEEPALVAVNTGADGIAAINTIKSVMNINLDNYESEPNVAGKTAVGGYSGKAVKPIALRFINDMKKTRGLENIPISGMGGIETWKDATEFIAMGCSTIQITTSVMQYGYRIVEDMIEGLSDYMAAKGITSVADMLGCALSQIIPAEQVDRETIEFPKFNRTSCVGCGRCYVSCYDGGHQAIKIDEKTGKPILNAQKCVGCQLCKLVCPCAAISAGTRIPKSKIKSQTTKDIQQDKTENKKEDE